MKNFKIFFYSIFLLIVITLFSFSIYIKNELNIFVADQHQTAIKNEFLKLNNKIESGISSYLKNKNFTFKILDIIIWDENKHIVYNDFYINSINEINKKLFIIKSLIIKNKKYFYAYRVSDLIDFLNAFTPLPIIAVKKGIYINKSGEINEIFFDNDLIKILTFNNIDFYFLKKVQFLDIFEPHIILIYVLLLFFELLMLYFLIKYTKEYTTIDLKFLNENFDKLEEVEPKLDEALKLKNKIIKTQTELKNSLEGIEELREQMETLYVSYKSFINDFSHMINNPLQNILDYIFLNGGDEKSIKIINNNIIEIRNIVRKFQDISKFVYLENDNTLFIFFKLNGLHNELIYSISPILNNKNIKIISEIKTEKEYVFSNKNAIFRIMYELLSMLLQNSDNCDITIEYIMLKNNLEIKITTTDTLLNDFLLLFNNKNITKIINFEVYGVLIIKEYLKILRATYYINQTSENTSILFRIPINYKEFFDKFDFENLKSRYIEYLVEKKYTVLQAEELINEILELYIEILKETNINNSKEVGRLKDYLNNYEFTELYNWLNYIEQNPEDKDVLFFKKILLEKLS
ncbi:hypothetical protein XO10_02655 [Marinitoga sp. 1135]|uniref:Uncharacterized protein n=1 Tax=Marinitoga piezophila (strain DSM 14283 / JCM 11233 / KA3) TaxID=443254 RepID=H2J5A2_MARPK|nr:MULTISPECIES: HAMP domain-containing histidine kinase [Marinitoga]AEX84960.1 hypothetical protein Marpi_0518 [Marinitoga piezophila KA3]NUU95192.1 hypothetical protein [Marinitoga sp. 1135]